MPNGVSNADLDWAGDQIATFAERRSNYEVFAATLAEVLEKVTKELAPGAILEARAKTIASFGEKIWRKRKEFLEGGRPRPERLRATILFLDMKDYTSRAEKMDPQKLMDWVNDFMSAMAQAVLDRGGVVDDYFGDGLMAIFGVPFPRVSEEELRSDAQNAVACALEFEQSLHRLNAKWRELPTVAMRVGIASGPVVAGSQGPPDRLKYTVVGDIVVAAQRLEALDHSEHDFERMPCRILITEQTSRYLDDTFLTHRIGDFQLKGKDEPVTVYRVRGRGQARNGGE